MEATHALADEHARAAAHAGKGAGGRGQGQGRGQGGEGGRGDAACSVQGAGCRCAGWKAAAHVIMYLSLSSLRMLRSFCISALAASTLAPAVEER